MEEGKRRVLVHFSNTSYAALEELAREQYNGDMATALRGAIALSLWFLKTRSTGDKILIERNGKLKEIVERR